jgi:hypothetical protein
MRGTALPLVALALLVLSACAVMSTARTTETTYLLDGKTYVLQEFNHADEHNFTLYELVNGERKFVALYDPGDGSRANVFKDPIPEDGGHLRTIMTVAQKGEEQGEAKTSSQQSLDVSRVFDPDFGD